MDWRVTPPKRVTSPTWGPPPPLKKALKRETSRNSLVTRFFGGNVCVPVHFGFSPWWTLAFLIFSPPL